MTDSDFDFDPEKDLWIPGRRRFMFLGALGSVAAALGLSFSSDIPAAVVPPKMVPTAIQAPGSHIWQVDLAPSPDMEKFWFVDTALKLEQRGESHLEFWQKTRHIVTSGVYEGSPGYALKVQTEGEED